MSNTLKSVYEQIHAETELKNHTKEYVIQKMQSSTKPKTYKTRVITYVVAAACMIFMILAGHHVYFTATTKISVDINPSIELSVNRFNQVVAVNSYNDDGKELAQQLDIRFQNYNDAIQTIMKNKLINALLSDDEIITFTVTGSDSAQSTKILSQIESDTADQANMYCFHASDRDVQQAHEAGMSFGKYHAYLKLKECDIDIDPQSVQNMTMREIHDLIHEHSQSDANDYEYPSGHGHHGHNGQGNQNGKGRNRNSE